MPIITLAIDVSQEIIDYYMSKQMHYDDIMEQLKAYILDTDTKNVQNPILTPTLIACIIEDIDEDEIMEVQHGLANVLQKRGFIFNPYTGQSISYRNIKEK